MDTPHCTLSCRYLIRVLIGSSCYLHPVSGVPFLCTPSQSPRLSVPTPFFSVLNSSFHACCHPSLSAQLITPLHLWTSLSLPIFISLPPRRAHVISSSIHTQRRSLPPLLIMRCHPHPPHLKLPFTNHIMPPSLYHYTHPFMHLMTSLPMCLSVCFLFCLPHYGPIKHGHVITGPWNIHVASHPSTLASHYIHCSQIWQPTNKNRQISMSSF